MPHLHALPIIIHMDEFITKFTDLILGSFVESTITHHTPLLQILQPPILHLLVFHFTNMPITVWIVAF